MIPSLDHETHTYSVNGLRPSSVTRVLAGAGMTNPHYAWLDPWYLERGSKVHKAIELELLGRLDWSSLDETLRPFVENWARWRDLIRFEPRVVEQSLYDPEISVAGTLDAFGESSIGPVLADWKTASYDKSNDVQVAGAYKRLLRVCAADLDIDPGEIARCRCFVVPLNSEMPKPVEIPRMKHGTCEAIFLSAVNVYNWRKRNGRLEASI